MLGPSQKIFILASFAIFLAQSLARAATGTGTGGASAQSSEQPPPPDYKTALPQFGVELSYSPGTFSRSPTVSSSSVSVSTFSAGLDYQPAIFQKYGVFGIGANGGLYILSPQGVLTSSLTDFYAVGGQLKYQAR